MIDVPNHKPVVAIIGGGFSGAAVAYHLARVAGEALSIIIFEPRAEIGPGLAYSTDDPIHRINVPAARMTLVPDDEQHFAEWLDRDGRVAQDRQATLPDGRSFPTRRLFGHYVSAQLEPFIQSGQIRHRRERVKTISGVDGDWHVVGTEGSDVQADIVVIATSHPPPIAPKSLSETLADHPKFLPDPWAAGALDRIGRDDRILIVGTGLTMADVVASLDVKGHRGPIIAISRRGQRSRGHSVKPVAPYGDFLTSPSSTVLSLLRHVRATVAAAADHGEGWQGVFDTLRTQGGGIWRALPLPEKRKLIRHLRPFWDTHRFRIAPQVEAILDRRIAEGTLHIEAASIEAIATTADTITVALDLRRGGSVAANVDAVITTTGPGHADILASQPFLASLHAERQLIADPTGLGLAVDATSRLVGLYGPHPSIFVAGPLARGEFGELMGLPEVSYHAMFVSTHIRAMLFEYSGKGEVTSPGGDGLPPEFQGREIAAGN